MRRETTIAAVALAVAPLLLGAYAATAQAREGALARASFIEAPKDTTPPAPPAEGEAQKQEGSGEAKPTPPAPQAPQAEQAPAGTPPAATQQPPGDGQVPATQAPATPADPKQAEEQVAEKQRAANEADAATEEAAAAAKAPKRFIPTQKSQADSSATFPIDI